MPKYTLDDAGKVKRVLLDGEDVTDRCTIADTDEGLVFLYPVAPSELTQQQFLQGSEMFYGDVEVELHEWAREPVLLKMDAEFSEPPQWLAEWHVEGYTHDAYRWTNECEGLDLSAYVIRKDGKRLEPEEIIARLKELDGHKTAYRKLTPDEKGANDA